MSKKSFFQKFLCLLLVGLILFQGVFPRRDLLAQNSNLECPPNSNSIWVRLDNNGDGTYTNINIPFDSGYDDTDVDGPGPDEATGYINYLTGVLIAEAATTNHQEEGQVTVFDNELLKALAVAARTVTYENCGPIDVAEHTGIDDSDKQNYTPIKSATYADRDRYLDAVLVTRGIYLTYNGDIFDVQYRDISRNPTNGATAPHLSIYDPAGDHHTGSQSKTGLPKINANHYATGQNHGDILPRLNYLQILLHYYTDIQIVDISGNVLTPRYRWDPLTVDWGGGAVTPPTMATGGDYNVLLHLQNTGTETWGDEVRLVYYWLRGSVQFTNATAVDVNNLTEGDNQADITLTIQVPDTFRTGDIVTLVIDLRRTNDGSGRYFHNRESSRPWFALTYPVCIGGQCKSYLPIIRRDPTPTPTPTPEPSPYGCQDYLLNGDFETGSTTNWTLQVSNSCSTPPIIYAFPQSSPGERYAAHLGRCNSHTDTLYQTITLPNEASFAYLSYDWFMATTETDATVAWDKMEVQARNTTETVLSTLNTITNRSDEGDWNYSYSSLDNYIGRTIQITYQAKNDASNPTSFYIDHVRVVACGYGIGP